MTYELPLLLVCGLVDDVLEQLRLIAALDTGSVSRGRSTEITRTLTNRFTDEYRTRELSGATREALHRFIADYAAMPGRRIAAVRAADR